jgi:hypothetical protein
MAFENQTLAQSMVRLFMGYIPTRVIYVAAKLELADHLGSNGASAQDVAQKIKVDPAALYRVMRVLAGLGVLRQDDNDRFYVTAFGDTLRKNSPQSVRDYALYSHELSMTLSRTLPIAFALANPRSTIYSAFCGRTRTRKASFTQG